MSGVLQSSQTVMNNMRDAAANDLLLPEKKVNPARSIVFVGSESKHIYHINDQRRESIIVVPASLTGKLGQLERDRKVIVALERSILMFPKEQVLKKVDQILSIPGTQIAVNTSDSSDEDCLDALRGMDRVLLFQQSAGSAVGSRPDRGVFTDIFFLANLVFSYLPKGGEVLFYDFQREFESLQGSDPLLLPTLINFLRGMDVYPLTNVRSEHKSVRSLYVENALSDRDERPAVSIVMPMYNAAELLQTTLDSIIAQDFKDFEIVIVDDGSTDDSLAIVEKNRARHPRIVVHRQENAGVSVARNRGLDFARGRYVCFLDADDLVTPGSLRRRYEFLEEGTYNVCGGLTSIIDQDGRSLNLVVGRRSASWYRDAWQVPCQISAIMGRSDVMKRQRFVPGKRYAEDWQYMTDIMQEGWQIGFPGEEPLSSYRWHASSATGVNVDNHFMGCLQLLEDLRGTRGQDLPIEEKPKGVLKLQSTNLDRARVSRIQGHYFAGSLKGGPKGISDDTLALMNAVEDHHPKKIDFPVFENIATRALVQPRFSDELREEILRRAPDIMRGFKKLRDSEANRVYQIGVLKYLIHLSDEMAKKGVKTPSRWRMRMRLRAVKQAHAKKEEA